jgi:S-adenosylmethionine decarboxylase
VVSTASQPGGPAAVGTYTHVFADFSGVSHAQLRDATLLSGLLIAAASGAGLTALGPPVVRSLPSDGLSGVLLLEGCHIAAHTMPERQVLLLDVLAPRAIDASRAVEIFARRLCPTARRVEQYSRG